MSTAPIDRVVLNAALGIRFWDVAAGTSSVEGLRVEVFPKANLNARRVALPGPGGIYVAHRVAGLREFEVADAEPDELWAMATSAYRIEVSDPHRRFLPFAFDAELPARGIFTWRAPWLSPPQPIVLPGDPGSPPQLLIERVPLFSAPSRPVPDPQAVVRAELRLLGESTPAAWTLLAVSIDGETRGLGLSDEKGRVAVIFPYPEPPRIALASPPEARNDFAWEIGLTAYMPYAASPPRTAPAIPDLADVLAALDEPRDVVESVVSPAAPLRLSYRQALTARTAGVAGADASFLFVAA